MDLGPKNGLMDLFIKVNGILENPTEMGNSPIKTVIHILVNSMMVITEDSEHTTMLKEDNKKDSGKQTNKMEWDKRSNKMGQFIKVNLKMEANTEKEHTHGYPENVIVEIG